MNKNKALTIAFAGFALIGLAACGTSEASATPEEPSSVALPAGSSWTTDAYGSTVNVTVGGVSATDYEDQREAVREYKDDESTEPVDYLYVEADNREGTNDVDIFAADVYDTDGNVYEFTSATTYLDAWYLTSGVEVEDGMVELETGDWVSKEEATSLYNHDQRSDALDDKVSVLEKGDFYLIGEELPEDVEIAGVEVYGPEINTHLSPA